MLQVVVVWVRVVVEVVVLEVVVPVLMNPSAAVLLWRYVRVMLFTIAGSFNTVFGHDLQFKLKLFIRFFS